MLAAGEQATAALMADGSVYMWGMQRYFVPTRAFTAEAYGGGAVGRGVAVALRVRRLQDRRVQAAHGRTRELGALRARGADPRNDEVGRRRDQSARGTSIRRKKMKWKKSGVSS